ncbi:hypothetical protein [Maritimibacter dapengensis]|nr:hypothetical protein [Maritimibacter dapengensis]
MGVTTGTGDRAAFNAVEPGERAHMVLNTLEDFTLDITEPAE